MADHYGYVQDKKVFIDCWLTIDPGKNTFTRRPSIRVTAGQPSMTRHERCINLKMELPLALFETPSIVARIAVDAPTEPVHIDAQTLASAVRSAIGMDVVIEVKEPEDAQR